MIQRKHKDIFERLLQDMARIISEIMGKSTTEHLVALQEAMEYYLQLNEEELSKIDGDDIMEYLVAKNFEHNQLQVTADFLAAAAKICLRDNLPDLANQKLRQAIAILEYLEAHHEVYSQNRRDTLAELKKIHAGL